MARATLELASNGLSLEIDRAAVEEVVAAGAELDQLDPDSLNLDEIILTDFVEGL